LRDKINEADTTVKIRVSLIIIPSQSRFNKTTSQLLSYLRSGDAIYVVTLSSIKNNKYNTINEAGANLTPALILFKKLLI